MSAQRERGGRRALSPLTRALVAGAATVLLTLSAGVASASTDALRTVATDDTDELGLTLVAAPAVSGIARPGEPLSVRVTVTNTGDVATGTVALSLAVDGGTDADAARLAAWFEGSGVDGSDQVTGAEQIVATATISPLEPEASAVLDLIVPDASAVLSGSLGARLASVRAELDATTLALDRTALVWVPEGATAPVAATTFVAAITTPGEAKGLLTAADLERYTSEAGALTRTLDAVAGRAVVLAIDPRILASVRALGPQAPASALDFLARLEAVPNESFLLPWADADPLATLAAAGLPLPTPTGIGTPPAVSGESSASPSPDPGPEQSVTLDALTTWPTTIDSVAWAEGEGLTADVMAAVADGGTTLLLAPSSALEQGDAVQRLGTLQVLRFDAALASAAREASLATSQQRFDRSMSRVSALLAASAVTDPGSPAVIALSREQLASTDRLLDTIAQTVALPWTTMGTLADALSRDPIDSAVVEGDADETRLAAVRAALSAEESDRVFASIAVTPEAITDLRRLELLAALSLGWGDRSGAALEGFVADSAVLQSSVQVVESSAITLLADRASLPVTVQNRLSVPVRVFVRIEPDSAQLRVLDPRVETLVEPMSQTRALVPVESLTNGQVDITVTVRDAESRVIGLPTRVSLNLQAGWETAGTIAVAIALLVLLVVGITRDIRKRRRRTTDEVS